MSVLAQKCVPTIIEIAKAAAVLFLVSVGLGILFFR